MMEMRMKVKVLGAVGGIVTVLAGAFSAWCYYRGDSFIQEKCLAVVPRIQLYPRIAIVSSAYELTTAVALPLLVDAVVWCVCFVLLARSNSDKEPTRLKTEPTYSGDVATRAAPEK